MRWENYILLILICLPLLSSGQRYVLEPDSDLQITDSTCIDLIVNTNVKLVRSINCSDNLLLSNQFSTVSFLNTEQDSVDYTFVSPGTYVAFCGSISSGAAVQSLCFNITSQPAEPIPTMGEWSLISLSLLLMIFMTVGFYNHRCLIIDFHAVG